MTCNVCLAEVGPKKILDLMNVPWLTRENVASHLQVFFDKILAKHSFPCLMLHRLNSLLSLLILEQHKFSLGRFSVNAEIPSLFE